jgi:anti-sigma factor RsiW
VPAVENEIRLMAYVDGELDPETASEVETLIATDPEARRLVELFRDTAALLRSACAEQFYADPTLPLLPRRRPIVEVSRRYANLVAVAAVAVAMGFGGGILMASWPVSEREQLVDEIAEYHSVQSKETKHLVEVPPSEAADLTTWLGRRLERHLEVPDLSGSGLQFAGGRMLVINYKPVAEFLYTRPNAPPVALCIARTGTESADVRVERREDLHLASWQEGGYTYVIAGILSPAGAQAVAERAKTQLSSY